MLSRRTVFRKAAFVVAVLSLATLVACGVRIEVGTEDVDSSNKKPTVTQSVPLEEVSPTETKEPTPTDTNTPEPTETPTRIPTSMDMRERNYALNMTDFLREGAMEPEIIDEVVFFNSHISDYYIEGDEIIFKVSLNVYGTEIEKTVRSNRIIFHSINLQTDEETEREFITAESNLSEYLDLCKEYHIGLILPDEPAITQEMVEDYINGYSEYDFNLDNLTRFDG
jgi:hypothetical protein